MEYLIAFLLASGAISLFCGSIYNDTQFNGLTVNWPYYLAAVGIVSGLVIWVLIVL